MWFIFSAYPMKSQQVQEKVQSCLFTFQNTQTYIVDHSYVFEQDAVSTTHS